MAESAIKIDARGLLICSEEDTAEALLRGRAASSFAVTLSADYFETCKNVGTKPVLQAEIIGDSKNAILALSQYWNLSSDNIEEYLIVKATESNGALGQDRVMQELDRFQKNNLIPLLSALFEITKRARSNNVVIGVGRGSSVASYCLYLIGLHRLNPLTYGLSFDEFMPVD